MSETLDEQNYSDLRQAIGDPVLDPGLLERAHSYKDKVARGMSASAGSVRVSFRCV